jgi:serine protease AprX
VLYVSLDKEVKSLGHVSLTTGADAVRTQTVTSPSGATTALDGSGVAIAVLDSGLYKEHVSFLGTNGATRVIVNKDFTGENRTDDPYGHGTHVASIAAGNGRISNGAYTGVAPNANLINLRVLNKQGNGTVSSVLGALDWVMINRQANNIRVVNMSIGMNAIDSYRDDPICRAVRKLVDAGVVVVAAAGNNGKTVVDRSYTAKFTRPAMSHRRLQSGPLILMEPMHGTMMAWRPIVHTVPRAATTQMLREPNTTTTWSSQTW